VIPDFSICDTSMELEKPAKAGFSITKLTDMKRTLISMELFFT